ncbi:hypothetical protein AAFX91_21115 [Bradyrhizobium sp. 31Argb]|uniref:hypothetical protein n=1 Tax=Bradyrhizobium sp. 31Argb TaxID=3141247 RepID=UPI003747F05B
MADEDNQTWLLDAGDGVIQRKAVQGYSSLSPLERLIYCLWAADYGMRNAGDLATAVDLHPAFLSDGKSAAQELSLPRSAVAFSLPSEELEQRYFGLFDDVVNEIRSVQARPVRER